MGVGEGSVPLVARCFQRHQAAGYCSQRRSLYGEERQEAQVVFQPISALFLGISASCLAERLHSWCCLSYRMIFVLAARWVWVLRVHYTSEAHQAKNKPSSKERPRNNQCKVACSTYLTVQVEQHVMLSFDLHQGLFWKQFDSDFNGWLQVKLTFWR